MVANPALIEEIKVLLGQSALLGIEEISHIIEIMGEFQEPTVQSMLVYLKNEKRFLLSELRQYISKEGITDARDIKETARKKYSAGLQRLERMEKEEELNEDILLGDFN